MMEFPTETVKTVKVIDTCRLCNSDNITTVLNFGSTGFANSLLTFQQRNNILNGIEKESKVNLSYFLCHDCGSIQCHEEVSPDILFNNYLYSSSTSGTLSKYMKEYCDSVINRFNLSENKKSFVVIVGSNDGVELKNFINNGIKSIGIEPATNLAEKANKQGYPTYNNFFDQKTAHKLVEKYGQADCVMANNVFAHTDLNEFVKSLLIILKPEGFFVFENSYLVDMIQGRMFDLLYHEHIYEHSITPLKKFFNKYDLEIFDIQRTKSHGGSFRCFVQIKGGPNIIQKSVEKILSIERILRLNSLKTYEKFLSSINLKKERLINFLKKHKKAGYTISGYGYPAKATTLCKFFDIGDYFEYIVEDSPIKVGRFTPNYYIPIKNKDYFKENPTDICIVLAWNYIDNIILGNPEYKGIWIDPFDL